MLERFLDEFGRKTTREKFLWGRRAALILSAALAAVFLAAYLLAGGKPVLAFGNRQPAPVRPMACIRAPYTAIRR